MKPPITKDHVLAHLRCIRARAQLAQTEIDFLGMAVRDELMSPAAAEAYINLYGLDYMQLANIEASRQAYHSGADAELKCLLDAEEALVDNFQERKPLERTP